MATTRTLNLTDITHATDAELDDLFDTAGNQPQCPCGSYLRLHTLLDGTKSCPVCKATSGSPTNETTRLGDRDLAERVDLSDAKSYATEANLRRALKRTGLDQHGCKYVVTRTPTGRWTAVFMAASWLTDNGGYVGFAAVHGFQSVWS